MGIGVASATATVGNVRVMNAHLRKEKRHLRKKASKSTASSQQPADTSHDDLKKKYESLQKDYKRVGQAFQNQQEQNQELTALLEERKKEAEELADNRPTVGWLSADSWLTVSRQVFWGALPHNYRKVNQPTNFRTQFHFIIQTKSWLNLSGHYGRWCWGFSVPNIFRLHVQPLLSKWDLHNKVWPIILILKMNISGLLYASYLVLLMNRNNIENHLTIIGY